MSVQSILCAAPLEKLPLGIRTCSGQTSYKFCKRVCFGLFFCEQSTLCSNVFVSLWFSWVVFENDGTVDGKSCSTMRVVRTTVMVQHTQEEGRYF